MLRGIVALFLVVAIIVLAVHITNGIWDKYLGGKGTM